jgi:hypothetical protein
MATPVTKFMTSDGKEFDTELEADGHEAGLKHAKLIEAYIAKSGALKAGAGMLRNHLPQFIAFQASYVEPANDGAGEAAA